MTDAITKNRNGKHEMAYVGETPWHGLGQVLTVGADIDTWKREAGMLWTIERSPVLFDIGNGAMETFEGQEVLYRSDNKDALGLVTPRYKPLQPGEVLEFFRDLVGAGGLELETAGTLLGGRKFWALAKTGHNFKLANGDAINGYLLLATSADGTMSTHARFTSVRVVCQNTLHIAVQKSETGALRVPHSAHFDPSKVKKELGLLDDSWKTWTAKVTKMSKKKMTDDAAKEFFLNAFAKEADEDTKELPPSIESVFTVYETAPGQEMAGRTVWGAVNAVTRYLDHEKTSRDPNIRLNNAWFKKGSRIKQKAWAMAEELVKVA